MGEVFTSLALTVFLLAGYVYAAVFFPRLAGLHKLMLGLTLGLTLLLWLPALCSFMLGFTLLSQLVALILAALPAALLMLRKQNRSAALLLRFTAKQGEENTALPDAKRFLLCVIPAAALCFCLLYTHVLLPVGDGSLHTGQSGFGDMAMHLSFITSIARNGVMPPTYSIQAGSFMGYPFLCDSVSSTFLLLGASLRTAYILPMLPALVGVLGWFYLLMHRWLGTDRAVVLAFLLFFVGGGFGFAYFLNDAKADSYLFTRIFTDFYQTPTNYVEENIQWVNPICDMLIPQRATLFGWSLLLPCLYLLVDVPAAPDQKAATPQYVLLGVLAGCLPLIHTHSFMALGILSAFVLLDHLLFQRAKKGVCSRLLLYGGIAAALALPQLIGFTFKQAGGEGFIRFALNWNNERDPLIWFYIKNMGLPFVLLPFAIANFKPQRRLMLCSLPIWLLAELVIFQPNAYDNNKLIFVCYMLLCGMAALMLLKLYDALKGIHLRGVLAGCVLGVMLLSGTLTIAREAVSDYELFSAEQVKAAEFAATLPKESVLLTADEHNNAFAALSGLTIVQGSPSYLYFHGVYDTQRAEDVKRMYSSAEELEAYKQQYGVTHVVVSPFEWAWCEDESIFAAYTLVYNESSTRIYDVR